MVVGILRFRSRGERGDAEDTMTIDIKTRSTNELRAYTLSEMMARWVMMLESKVNKNGSNALNSIKVSGIVVNQSVIQHRVRVKGSWNSSYWVMILVTQTFHYSSYWSVDVYSHKAKFENDKIRRRYVVSRQNTLSHLYRGRDPSLLYL